jgi:hypothetical protein
MADAYRAAHMEVVQFVQDIHNSHAVHLTQAVQFVHQIILVHIAMDMDHVPYVERIISVSIAAGTPMALAQHADVLHPTLIIATVQTITK